ncbi:MAG: SulP family inorganic anion transporter [Chloroflexota bacterium]
MAGDQTAILRLGSTLESIPAFFLRPLHFLKSYPRQNWRPDAVAGLTVAIVLLPQAIAFALIAELPPEMGIYAAIVGSIYGALWGSSNQALTSPNNAISLLVLSTLLSTAANEAEFIVAAGLLAIMAGVFQLVLGVARLGQLVNFVSHSVIVGFASGAGVLIAIGQLRHLLGESFTGRNALESAIGAFTHWQEINPATAGLGAGAILLIFLLRRLRPRWPAPPVVLAVASLFVFALQLEDSEVQVIGELPGGLPPLAHLRVFDLDLIARLSTGALAVGAIGLVQTTAVTRSLATQTGQRLDSNQEFVGQGLANVAAGLFSGYPCAASFSASAVNYKAGARSPVAAVMAGLFVLVASSTLAPLAAYLPRAALSGILIVTAVGMIDRREMARIWRGAREDAVIMVVTLLGTLFLQIEFAVLAGILLSFALYILRTSTPRVLPVWPDDNFRHFVSRPPKPFCPQLAILDILGDLYFGAVSHVEKAILQHAAQHPSQRFLLLRMQSVNQCDYSGIHMLESVVRAYRDRGGDVYMVRLHEEVLALMKSSSFYDFLGADHFLAEDKAVEYLFYKVLDPAICIYESDVRVFRECQNLPRPEYPIPIPLPSEAFTNHVPTVEAKALWQELHVPSPQTPPLVLDVREPREFKQGHIPGARSLPMPTLFEKPDQVPHYRQVVLACRTGRRSRRVAAFLCARGHTNVAILEEGMLAWENAGLLEAVD